MARRTLPSRHPLHAALAWLLAATATHGTAATPDASAVALPLLLARAAPQGIEPAPYLVSEKLDGVRALWDGQQLRFRSGRPIPAPGWFLSQLPAQPLDGELWLGRGRFDALSALVRSAEPSDAAWREVRYMVFEIPGGEGTFLSRTERLRALVAAANTPQLQHVEQRSLRDARALQQWLDEVVAQGGEGLMLHRADAPALSGRSDALLKLKPQHDAEATVIGHLPGQGQYRGQTGALRLRTAAGITFALGAGLSNAQRRDPPPVGSIVSYRYRDVTPNGKPRFASFLRVRDDF